MANLDDLDFSQMSNESVDDAIEQLRQIRLSRRTPVSRPSKNSVKKKTNIKNAKNVNADQAAEILKLLGGSI